MKQIIRTIRIGILLSLVFTFSGVMILSTFWGVIGMVLLALALKDCVKIIFYFDNRYSLLT